MVGREKHLRPGNWRLLHLISSIFSLLEISLVSSLKKCLPVGLEEIQSSPTVSNADCSRQLSDSNDGSIGLYSAYYRAE